MPAPLFPNSGIALPSLLRHTYHCKLPPEITVAGCWTHMRQKFTDTLKSLPKDLRDRSPAKIGLNYCDKLFRLESDYTEGNLSFQERYQARLEQSKPVAEKLFDWSRTEYEKNPVPKSMLGAAVYSIVETAKANGLRPFPHLKLLLERLPFGVPAQACLPWNDSVQSLCK